MFARIGVSVLLLVTAGFIDAGEINLGSRAPDAAPSFVPGPDIEADEDAPPQTYFHWASEIRAGSAGGSGQGFHFEVSTKDSTLFATLPQIDASGTLTFALAHGANGSTLVTAFVVDDGDPGAVGENWSDPVEFIITIHPVNDPPVFENLGDVVVPLGTGLFSVPGWAYHIGPGSQFEVGQTFTFVVDNSFPGMFVQQPAVDGDGRLTFTPAPGAHGSVVVTVVLRDSGGVDRGGSDASLPSTFAISIGDGNRPPMAIAEVSPACWLSQLPSRVVVISANRVDARVEMDGSMSFDPDGDDLSFEWFVDGPLLASAVGPTIAGRLDVGIHTLWLSVSDGQAHAEVALEVDVITMAEAVEALGAEVERMGLNRSVTRWLRNYLSRAGRALERGRVLVAVRELAWFERSVRVWVIPRNRVAGMGLIRATRQIVAAGNDFAAPGR